MTNARYWIWLQKALGEGAVITKIVEEYGSAKNLYDTNILQWGMSGLLTATHIEKLSKANIEDCDKIIEDCIQNNWDIITPEDSNYPKSLFKILDMPAVLYCWGKFPDFNTKFSVSIVGTRKASKYAVECGYQIAGACAVCDAIVVSGGALGVDSSAHQGAISVGGTTVAVLGCGLGTEYLKSNQQLRETIVNIDGAVITEYPPFFQADKTTFPRRNRIVAGLSTAVIIVEAGLKSGSLITANIAIKQGKDVFAVSGSILNDAFRGTNKLISDGIPVVTSIESVMENYKNDVRLNIGDLDLLGSRIKAAKEQKLKKDKKPETTLVEDFEFDKEKNQLINSLDDLTLKIYNSLTSSYQHIDIIIQNTNLNGAIVLASLTQLEMFGLIKSSSGKQYRKD